MSYKYFGSIVCFVVMTTLLASSCGVSKVIKLQDADFEMINREAATVNDQKAVEIKAMDGAGLAMIDGVSFEKGAIEIEIKGENKPGQSFVGLAFNIEDEATYEAIYFRPFNFLSDEKIRREHGIQYTHSPNYEWRKLRTEHEGVYEAEFQSPPNPNDWFKIRLNISPTTVEVIDSRNGKILMSVERLAKQQSNKIALWTGHRSKGSFQKLQLFHD